MPHTIILPFLFMQRQFSKQSLLPGTMRRVPCQRHDGQAQ